MEVEQLITAAKARTGLDDLGDDSVFDGLNIFVDAVNREARLSESGHQILADMLVTVLANRLRIERYLGEHPGLLDRPIDRPMFVFGLPRTGTTLAINLLNADPARRCFLRWEAFDSVPPPRAGELSTDPRCVREQAAIDLTVKHMPHIAAVHYEDADSPTECQLSMAHTFCAEVYEALVHVPRYRDWYLNTSYLPAFRWHKRLLQLLQADAPGRWTLKNPWHPLFLDDLATVYPDAQLVMTHRDPVEVMASSCSMLRHFRAMYSDHIRYDDIVATLFDTFDKMIERTLAYRQRQGWDSIYDVRYDALMADPVGTMKKLYRHFDEPFTAQVEAAMRACLAAQPKNRFGRHEYSLAEFGLTSEEVSAHFRNYCERFDIRH